MQSIFLSRQNYISHIRYAGIRYESGDIICYTDAELVDIVKIWNKLLINNLLGMKKRILVWQVLPFPPEKRRSGVPRYLCYSRWEVGRQRINRG